MQCKKNTSNQVSEGDCVLVVLDLKRKWFVRAETGKELHTHKGIIDLGSLIGLEFGSSVESSGGTKFYVFDPILPEIVYKFKHATQIMYPKDYGLILIFGGIVPGSRVIEAGVGSGALTAALATYVGEKGKVYGYEVREENLKTAKENLEKAKVLDFVVLKLKDASQGFDEINVDSVVLDMGEPWKVIHHAYKALHGGGTIAVFVPTFNQVDQMTQTLKQNNFGFIRVIECFIRDLEIKKGAVRPSTRMIGHTGFIIFARKLT